MNEESEIETIIGLMLECRDILCTFESNGEVYIGTVLLGDGTPTPVAIRSDYIPEVSSTDCIPMESEQYFLDKVKSFNYETSNNS